MSELLVAIPKNSLIDRLRKLESDMIEDNEHDKAFLISVAIEAIKQLGG